MSDDRRSSAVQFLSALFEHRDDESVVWLASLPNVQGDHHNPPKNKAVETPDQIDRFVEAFDRAGRGVYFGVATVASGTTHRNKETALESLFAFIDVDYRSLADAGEREVRAALLAARCPPTAIVRSGRGIHAYWKFKEPLASQDHIERLEALCAQIADIFGGDLNACKIAGLMRLPGSHNSKEGLPGGAKALEVVCEHFGDAEYDPEELEEWASETAPVLARKTAEPRRQRPGRAPRAAPDNPYLHAAEASGFQQPLDIDQALEDMVLGENVHATQVSVSAAMMNAGASIDEVVDKLIDATAAAAGELGTRWNWKREKAAIRKMCLTWQARLDKEAAERREERKAAEAQAAEQAARARAYAQQRASAPAGEDDGDQEDEQDQDAGGAGPKVINLNAARAKRKRKAKATSLHHVLAEATLAVMAQHGEAVMFHQDGTRWIGGNGYWRMVPDAGMKDYLDNKLETACQALKIESKGRLVSEARGLIQRTHYEAEPIAWDAHGMVPTSSGLIHPVTGEIRDMKLEDYCTWRLELPYQPSATCSHWLQMLNDALADREDDVRAEYVQLIQEIIGMGLVDRKPKALSRALIPQGSSNKGKSEVIEVIAGLYGGNVITAPLDALEGSHGLMPFTSRRPWILHEAFDAAKWHMSALVKSLISGDPVGVNIKNGPMVTTRYTAPIIWGTNVPPQFKETTPAIINRIAIVEFRTTFDEDAPVGAAIAAQAAGYQRPHELVIATELPGVLAWAIEGLRRALARGYFIQPEEAKAAAQAVRDDGNAGLNFMRECFGFDPDGMVRAADVRTVFDCWWRETHGDGPGKPSYKMLTTHLRQADPRIGMGEDFKKETNRHLGGIQLNTLGLELWDAETQSDKFQGQARSPLVSAHKQEVNRTIPDDWKDRPGVKAMRKEFTK